ncbi:ATP-dependent DNA helicase RecQ [Euzebya sp.]|uniref:RecQ family ATP-dependent DNA helicase n=1 Tax=Euzebya sp. TaxID=1971409 RepID=UPI003516B662
MTPDATAQERADLIETVAHAALGYEELHEGQLEATRAALSGRDVLVVMPTGSGKSAIYQMAGALAGGTVVVISPLLALQRDQIVALGGRLGGAVALNSTLSRSERDEVMDQLASGERTFVFLAPEQLRNDDTRAQLAEIGVRMLVVDEAHCIASWGHDFRPAYLQLGESRAGLGDPQVLALTATASAPIRREIIEELRMDDPVVVSSGIVRPSITLDVVTTKDLDAATRTVVDLVAETAGTGLVYVATRAAADELAATLATDDRPALAYHAGLPTSTRTEVEARFAEPDPVVVIATTAFGMGVDVPHVRFVIHREAPASLDDYYQEFGRAGRDGDPARAVLVRTLEHATSRRMEGGVTQIEPATFDRVARGLAAIGDPVDVADVADELDMTATRLTMVVEHFTRTGAIRAEDAGTLTWTGDTDPDEAVEDAVEHHRRDQALARSQVAMMREYVDTAACRWRTIGAYFGEPDVEACGACDNCRAGTADTAEGEAGADHDLVPGTRVTHASFGAGTVEGVEGRRLMVLFDEAGYRTLAADVALAGDLLTVD